MNNNQSQGQNQNQNFSKGQPQAPRSPEKIAGTGRDGQAGVDADNLSKSSGTGNNQFKPGNEPVAKNVKADKKTGIKVGDDIDTDNDTTGKDTTDCGSGCGTGKMN